MKRKKIIYFIGSIAVLGLAVALTGFFMNNQAEPKKSNQQEALLSVKIDTVETQKMNPAMSYEGRINSYETVSLAAEVSGRIMAGEVPLKEGADFEKGDLLVRIYDEDTRAAVTSGKSNFLRTLSSILPDVKVDFPEAYDKWKDFFNAIDVKRELPELPRIDSEQEQVFLASRGVLSEYYSLRQQEINLDKYNIYAPFDGAFMKVNQQVGAIANPGVALASIVRTDRLEVVVPVPPEDAQWVSAGDPVRLKTFNSDYKTGTVTRIADFLDPSTQSVNVYVQYIPRDQGSFKVGEFVEATFKISRQVRGFTIPREALLNESQVYIVNDHKLKKKPVEIIRKMPDHAVVSGLADEELVVIESLVDVEEGQKVKTR